ncbi:MAG: HAD family phosphatase [Spirochaetaceae bacterium]|nr:HAD family phosphatase [Spirochaetaceae bacterium]
MNTEINIKPQAAIFDLDGLMLDTERPFLSDFKKISETRGWDISEDILIQTIGIDNRATKDFLCKNMGQDFPFDEIYGETNCKQVERFEREGIPHRPGLLSLLDYLKDKKIPMAVATSTWAERGRWKLKCGAIEQYFAFVITGDQVSHGKPAPDIFLRAAEKLGFECSACAGLEDSPAGLRALKAAGIRSIFIKDLLEPPAEILETVWRRCTSLTEVRALF